MINTMLARPTLDDFIHQISQKRTGYDKKFSRIYFTDI